ncbi:helix-turn-helix domain-containing protein [Actinomadura rupiterrae]|uniref:helix-turn-helix domain-containing protein n=1 Tax=Actinomadura rupiterrae TaxID=559627 RepID=UPI0020A373B3|nr:helix-turn-helix transcriptional regulator [Actinomadura rupiterrae]MCP2336561.1 transcriptional regulator with XRE-family HTH domain [Actinomadura rupiterrae]
MSSPYVRRRRLAIELRDLRESHGLTADDLAARIHQSRVKISKLENAHGRPDLADVMNILRALEIPDKEWRHYMELATDAARKGWWDKYGDTMGDRQRIYADLESGAESIREYQPGILPGILQTEEYMRELVDRSRGGGPIKFVPERMIKARLQRQETVLRPDGPHFEAILDEVGLRRYHSSAEVYVPQLHHMVTLVESHPRVSLRILPLRTEPIAGLMPRAPMSIYTFQDPEDPTVLVEPTVTTDLISTLPSETAHALKLYEHVRSAALSEVSSLGFLSSLADEIGDTAGSTT